jgi:exosortase
MSEDLTKEKARSQAEAGPAPRFELPNLKEFAVLLAVWVALFHFYGNSTLGYVRTPSLFGWWQWTMKGIFDQDHAYLLPFVVAGLIYHRRAELAPIPKGVWWPALFILAGALLIHAVGFLVQQARVSVFAFVVGVYALTGLMWGRGWLRATFLPFSLLVFCVPLGTGAEPLTFPLRLAATKITAVISHYILGIDVIQRGNLLFDAGGHYQYEVAAACSGIRSLTAIAAFCVIYAYLSFRSPWRIGVLLFLGLPMAVLANVVRLVMIISAAELYGQGAGDFVHKNWALSLVPYVPAIAGVLLAGRLLRPREKESRPPDDAMLGKAQEA